MDNSQVEQYIAEFKSVDFFINKSAAIALRSISDASAVPALIDARAYRPYGGAGWDLGDIYGALVQIGTPAVQYLLVALKRERVREFAVAVLEQIGDPSAISALIEAMKYDPDKPTYHDALVKIGTPAVPALIERLKTKRVYGSVVERLNEEKIYMWVLVVLRRIGDENTLPRKILAESRFSVMERIKVLEELGRFCYKGRYPPDYKDITFRYSFPNTHTLCQTVLNEENIDVCLGAQAVLNWLNGERDLLRASQADTTNQATELLRAAQGGESETQPETLLRAANESEEDAERRPPEPTLWDRLFRKRK